MSEYIKKEEEIECLEAMKKANMNFDDRYIYAKVIQQVKDMPTADVVEVVRCKNCKYVETNRCPMYRAHFGYTDDDFCSIGESYAEDMEQERSEMGVK